MEDLHLGEGEWVEEEEEVLEVVVELVVLLVLVEKKEEPPITTGESSLRNNTECLPRYFCFFVVLNATDLLKTHQCIGGNLV